MAIFYKKHTNISPAFDGLWEQLWSILLITPTVVFHKVAGYVTYFDQVG